MVSDGNKGRQSVSGEMPIEINCRAVWRELSNYLEGSVSPALRQRMEEHFRHCRHCTALLEGASNTLRLVADDRAFDLPAGFAERLWRTLNAGDQSCG